MQKPAQSASLVLIASAVVTFAADALTYQKPPQAILDVLNSPEVPSLAISPSRTYATQGAPVRNPPIAELSQPMLRLAGIRINPRTNGLHAPIYNASLSLRKIPGGEEVKVDTPPNPRLGITHWSPDSSRFAFTNTTTNSIELWIGDPVTGKTHKLPGVHINGVMGGSPFRAAGRAIPGLDLGSNDVQWLPDNKSLLVEIVPSNRGSAPKELEVPAGPHVQESLGGARGSATLEDMLQNPHDEDLFEYYATSQLAVVDAATGKWTPVGKPALIESVRISPDGKHLLVTTIHKPFSYLLGYRSFPKEIEIWDRNGKVERKVASLPLQERVSLTGVQTGPRNPVWKRSDPATLIWVEALDNGDLKNNVPFRDKVVALKAPFTGEPAEILKTEQRFQGIQFFENGSLAFVEDFERRRRWQRTFLVDLDHPGSLKLIWERNNQDRYKDPGRPLQGVHGVLQNGDDIFLTGLGSSPTGDHPFLDRFNLKTLKSERLFGCDDDHYEVVEAVLDAKGDQFLTRRESPAEPPNYYVRTAAGGMTAMTHFADPQPLVRKIRKELVKYKRPDGVDLSFTLYLPPDYQPGTKLPTVMWAYPYEYNDAETAGQVTGSTKRFTELTSSSGRLFFVLKGYAVLDNAAMPIVGDADTVNNTYVEQITADAKAAIDTAASMGVTDPNRVAVGGHSYGAFMTANLLAHTKLFKAGLAESGAHNRTLTPFGFQTERRTLWEVPDVYLKMSPFMYADKIKTPILLIHGEVDDNAGTFPIQSDRMYQAIRGNGGITRLVFLPAEAHGYRAKETIEHVLWEEITWLDKYVKDPPPAVLAGSGSSN